MLFSRALSKIKKSVLWNQLFGTLPIIDDKSLHITSITSHVPVKKKRNFLHWDRFSLWQPRLIYNSCTKLKKYNTIKFQSSSVICFFPWVAEQLLLHARRRFWPPLQVPASEQKAQLLRLLELKVQPEDEVLSHNCPFVWT